MKADMEQKDFWWKNPEYILPYNPEEIVLVIVSGRLKNVVFDDAIQLGTYSKKEGWIIEGFEEMENIEIYAWARIPCCE